MDYRKRNNIMLIIGAIIAAVLLLFWLFAGTTLEEDANPVTGPAMSEQNN